VKFYLHLKTFYEVMPKCHIHSGPVFRDTYRQGSKPI